MPNSFFKFKQFTVHQDRCAMKVGTDGTLLGAWAHGGRSILDVGTGTGLIALMMAQRFPQASLVGIDVDEDACRQASENVAASPFKVDIVHGSVLDFEGTFDCIVSNPPYFEESLECPDGKRTMARHASALSYRNLMQSAWRMLTDDGELSIVIPADCKDRMESEATLAGFSKSRECAVKTTLRKPPRRYLLAYRKHAPMSVQTEVGFLEIEPGVRSEWYRQLTQDFYL